MRNPINNLHIQGGGIQKPKWDPRRFSHKKAFGAIAQSSIPADFSLGNPLEIKNQVDTDFCYAFSSDGVSQFQEGVVLSPEFMVYATQVVKGNWQSFGADPDSVCKAQMRFGCIEDKDSPFHVGEQSRDFIANPANWEQLSNLQDLISKAGAHKKGSYFEVDGGSTLFDSIREALYQSYLMYQKTQNPSDLQPVWVGADWQAEWTNAPDGVVPIIAGDAVGAHAFYFFASKTINGKVYLAAANSYGTDLGDHGIWWFPQEAVNTYFFFARVFRDFDPKNYQQQYWNILQWAYDLLISFRNWVSSQPQQPPQDSVQPIQPAPVSPPQPQHISRIIPWAKAIQQQEGWSATTLSFINNNPGNLKLTSYTQSLGATQGTRAKDGGYFCKFADYQTGFNALCTFLTDACNNQLALFHDKTLLQFTKIYANPPSNKYALSVAKALGVDVNILIKELL